MDVANEKELNILRAVILRISGSNSNRNATETRELTCITSEYDDIFFEQSSMYQPGTDYEELSKIKSNAFERYFMQPS